MIKNVHKSIDVKNKKMDKIVNTKLIKNVCLKECSIVMLMGQELLSTSLVAAVCQDSNVFLTRPITCVNDRQSQLKSMR